MAEGYFDFPASFKNLGELKAWLDELEGTQMYDFDTVQFENFKGVTELCLLVHKERQLDGSINSRALITTGKSNEFGGFVQNPV